MPCRTPRSLTARLRGGYAGIASAAECGAVAPEDVVEMAIIDPTFWRWWLLRAALRQYRARPPMRCC